VSGRLQGRAAVVSGAGSGIGRAIAAHLAAEGAHVVVTDIVADRAADSAAQIARAGGTAAALVADASSNDGVAAMLAEATGRYGRLDILVNNAGITDNWRTLEEVSDEVWQRNIDVNLSGPFKACRAALPIMLAQGGGAIVNLASISAFRGGRAGLAYSVTKHGVLGLTRCVAVEYGAAGIRCNCISPGSVITNIVGPEGMSPEGSKLREKGLVTRPERAQPGDIAPTVVFLVSDDARYVNGENVVIDAGWTAW
jgi:NAD(P)-dependent dehydrogenase (short-subunit alcohol dehydrogenase family)